MAFTSALTAREPPRTKRQLLRARRAIRFFKAYDFHARIRSYFETLSSGYQEIRRRHGLTVSDGFMCHRCAYMQLECDIDRTEPVAA